MVFRAPSLGGVASLPSFHVLVTTSITEQCFLRGCAASIVCSEWRSSSRASEWLVVLSDR